jgi:hypothetical protein
MQSITQSLVALYCKTGTQTKKSQLVKVTVKWGIQQKRQKKAFKMTKPTQPQIIEPTTRQSIARITTPSLAKFDLNEKIFAWDRNHLYDAKIVKMKVDAIGCAKYLVHYVGYPKSHDRWLTSDFMLRDNS